jgi:hypothetical protein
VEGFSTPPYTKRIAALHAKPHPIGPPTHCSTLCGISNPPALLLCPARAVLPQIPTHAEFPWDETLRLGIHRHLQLPPGHVPPPRLAQPCIISALLGHTPRPAVPEIQTRMISIPLGHNPKACTTLQELRFAGLWPPQPCKISALLAMPPRPAEPCKISTLLGHALRHATPEIQTHTISILLGQHPKACTALQNIHSTSLCS